MKNHNIFILRLFAAPLAVALALLVFGCEGVTQKTGEVPEGLEQLTLPEEGVTTPSAEEGLSISNSALAAGTYKVAYSQTIEGAGGSDDYAVSLEGTLPTGISLSGNTISGTPEQVGNFPLEIKLTDNQSGDSVEKSLGLLINKETPTITVSRMNADDLWEVITDDNIEVQLDTELLFQVEGNAPGYTWSLIDAHSDICLTISTPDLLNHLCDSPLGPTDQSNFAYILSTNYTLPTPIIFKVRVVSDYSNPVEKTVKFTGVMM